MQVMDVCGKRLCGGLAGLALLLGPVLAGAATDETLSEELANVVPPQVFQEAQILAAEIEQIRQYLGRRAPRERSFGLADALPRQTFYQSQTLFRKSNQLAQEIAGVSRERPAPAPDREIVPGDVLKMLQDTRGQIAYVRAALEITEQVPTPKLQRRRTPSDVMVVIIDAGYVLNQLIDETADWSDIYDRVAQMIVYAGAALPAAQRYPALPEYQCCKMPQDVYQKLGEALAALTPLAKATDFALVRIIAKKTAEGGASTATVFDLTTTLVYDIGEITLLLGAEELVDPPNYERPKRILPADVYRLAVVLEQQLRQIKPK